MINFLKKSVFIREYDLRTSYLDSPPSKEEFERISSLSRKEKLTLYLIILIFLVLCSVFFFFYMRGSAQSGIALCFSFLFLYITSFQSPLVIVNIEGATFTSRDSLAQYKSERHDRLCESFICTSKNVYAPGSIQFKFVEKVRSMERPLMRFEVDILNSLSKNG